jgi:hypothetical protein
MRSIRFILNIENISDWKAEVENIFKWVYKTLKNEKWEKYGVTSSMNRPFIRRREKVIPPEKAPQNIVLQTIGRTTRMNNAIRELDGRPIWSTWMKRLLSTG